MPVQRSYSAGEAPIQITRRDGKCRRVIHGPRPAGLRPYRWRFDLIRGIAPAAPAPPRHQRGRRRRAAGIPRRGRHGVAARPPESRSARSSPTASPAGLHFALTACSPSPSPGPCRSPHCAPRVPPCGTSAPASAPPDMVIPVVNPSIHPARPGPAPEKEGPHHVTASLA